MLPIYFVDIQISPVSGRVSISGEDTSGVPLEDLERASKLVIQALELRERYMSASNQSFPPTTARFLKSVHEKEMSADVLYEDKRTTAGTLVDALKLIMRLMENRTIRLLSLLLLISLVI